MSDKDGIIPRASMPAAERKARSRLAQRVAQRGILRGSLLLRRRVCGKAGCKCTRGKLHESLYLVITEKGKTRQLYVPKDWEPRVRRWVVEYHQARGLMEEVSRIYWNKVRQRQD